MKPMHSPVNFVARREACLDRILRPRSALHRSDFPFVFSRLVRSPAFKRNPTNS